VSRVALDRSARMIGICDDGLESSTTRRPPMALSSSHLIGLEYEYHDIRASLRGQQE
jgi:hypothetical protein